MSFLTFTFLFVAVISIADQTYGVSEKTKKEMTEKIVPIMMECVEEFHLDEKALAEMEKLKEVTKENSCLVACVLKKTGLLDSKGMIQEDKAFEHVHLIAESEEEEEKIQTAVEACMRVNSEPVTDGDQGCERVLLLMSCFKVQAEKLGLKE